LLHKPFTRVGEYDGQVGSGRTGDHVARILLMARSVESDEAPARSAEVAMSYVDGYSLLALSAQAVDGKREIKRVALSAITH
jgi:hypothetical protein